MKIEEAIKNYINYLKLNFSDGTVRCNNNHLKHFLNYCNNNDLISAEDINYDELVNYIVYQKKTCKNTTINKRLGMIKRMLKFNDIKIKDIDKIKKLKEDINTFDLIQDNDFYKIYNYILDLSEQHNNLMYKCLILLLIDTGARVNEIINIKINNIDLFNQEILLTLTKTKQDRIVYFRSKSKELINNIIKQKNKSQYLLYNRLRDRQINYDDVKYIFNKIKYDLNIKKLHPHMFRHTLATKLIENDADLFSVMKILGHKNIKTTERYTHIKNKHVRDTYFNKYTYEKKVD